MGRPAATMARQWEWLTENKHADCGEMESDAVLSSCRLLL